jgi:hypothetical protein
MGGVTQVVERLPSKCNALILNLSATKGKKKKKAQRLPEPQEGGH